MDIRVTPLGAGQDVGRSCLLLSIGLSLFFTSDIVPIYSGGKNVMLDCGMHMGYSDDRLGNIDIFSEICNVLQIISQNV